MNSILIIIGLVLVGAGISYLIYFLQKKNKRLTLKRELEMQLFSIRIPQIHVKEGQAPNFKQEINLSEQLFASFSSLKLPFAFEIAVHHIGENIHFYIALHKSVSDAAIKQIQGIWPDAQVAPAHEFNIFNPAGVHLGSYLTQKENFALPIKTYQEIEGDTFGPIISGLAKLDDMGEGAALQVMLLPADKSYKKTISRYIESLKKGLSLKTVLKSGAATALSNVAGAFSMKDDKDKREEPKIIDESAIKALEMKASKPLFRVNVRVIVSAKNDMQTDYLVNGLTTGFSQFASPLRNGFKIISPKNPEKLLYQYSFREFENSQAMILNSEEIASFFHLPISSTDIPRIKWLKSKEASPPVDLPAGGLLIGESFYRGENKPVFLLEEDRRRHMYIIGQTGTGKSTLMYNMAMGDIRSGKGVGVIDPNGDLIQNILASMPKERVDDLILFDPTDIERPLGMNMLEYDRAKPEYKTFIVNEVQGIFNRLFPPESMGPMFEQYMRNALLLLMEDAENEPSTLTEVPRVFTDTDYRERRLDRIKNPAVQDFWRNEASKAGGEASLANMTPYITSKFNNFIANDFIRPIISQVKSAFDFREMMDEGKILLVNLSKGRLSDINAGLLGMVIVGKMQMAAFSRADTMDQEKRRDFYMYIDEFQNFTTDSIATIFSEARKYRLNLIVAHQYIGQLTEKIRDSVFGNVGSMVALRVGATDAEFLVKQFEPIFNQNDLVNIDNLNAYVKLLIKGATSKPFNMKVFLDYRMNNEWAEKLRELNRLKFGMDRAQIEAEVYKRLRD